METGGSGSTEPPEMEPCVSLVFGVAPSRMAKQVEATPKPKNDPKAFPRQAVRITPMTRL